MGKKIPKKVDDVSDIADFLFATKSIERIAKGAGTWGDLIDVGITAASFFIPPLRLASLPAKSLTKVILNAEKVIKSDVASVAAKRVASKTLDDALAMKRQGYIPEKPPTQRFSGEFDQPVERLGRTGMGEPTPPYQVTERTTPTPKHLDDLFGTPDNGQQIIPYAMKGKPVATRTTSSSENVYDGTSSAKDLTIRRQPRKTQAPSDRLVTAYAADAPSRLTPYILDEIDELYELSAKTKMSDREFNARRAGILLQLFPETNILPDIPDVARTSRELFTSSAAITNTKKKAIIRKLKESDNPDDVRLAKELEDLDIKTLRQEATVNPGRKKGDPQVVTLREVPSETTAARSALQPELDDVLYQKELAEKMLKETSDLDVIEKIVFEIEKLDRRAIKLQKYIDNPYSTGAMDQTKKTILTRRPGRDKVEYKSPKSYQAKESIKKSGKAPNSPARSYLSDLKSDEETILKQLKTAKPDQRKALQADLKRTRKEIMNIEVRQLRQKLDDEVKKIPAANKSVENLTLKELESELIRLRKGYKELSKFTSKEAKEALEQIEARGKAVKELLEKAKTRAGKPASDIANMGKNIKKLEGK